MSIDKLFNGPKSILNQELLSLYSREIVIKQTNNAPEVSGDTKGIIYVDFPRDIAQSHKIIQRNLVEYFMKDYWDSISKKLRVKWNMDTMKKISLDFIKESKLILIKPDTTDNEILSLLRDTLGLSSPSWWPEGIWDYWWDGIAIRILQIGAIAKSKINPSVIETGATRVLISLEKRLLSKLTNRI